jgi:hypothetical protein
MTARIGDPMTDGQAFTWLTSGESPAGRCSVTRARTLMSFARDAGAVHLTCGPDLCAPGRILTYLDGIGYELFRAAKRQTTPGNVAYTLQARSYQLAGGGHPGWVTMWAGGDAVRVEWHGQSLQALRGVKRTLEHSRWHVELVQETSAAWLRVTQKGPLGG